MFFKKRAVYEDEYGRNMQKLAKATAEAYAINEGKAGFVLLYASNSTLSNSGTDPLLSHGKIL